MGCWAELTQLATFIATEPDIRASGSKEVQASDEAQDSVPARRHWILFP